MDDAILESFIAPFHMQCLEKKWQIEILSSDMRYSSMHTHQLQKDM
jgi:hypothetical protein